MTDSDARRQDDECLSANARRMLDLRDEVLREWASRLRSTVKEAETLPHPILINTFPVLYDKIAEAISPSHQRTSAVEGNTTAAEHGGERARLTAFNAQAVVTEYQLLRWTIFDVMAMNGIRLDSDEFFAINSSIDDAIREAVNAFSLAQAALRDRFVTSLTHDLRNPLASIHVAAELIFQTAEIPHLKQLASRITSNVDRMDAMIRDLLDAVVFQAGERPRLHIDEFDVMHLAEEVHEEFTSLHGDRFRLTGTGVQVWWDRQNVKRAIENLLGNAVKYGKAGSVVTLNIQSEHERVLLNVHNEGAPIPPDQLESVFQVFRRAIAAKEGDKQGWGIGLPYVRSVAESHGGSVGIDSAEAQGTTFTVDMPADARPYQSAPVLGTDASG